MMDFGLDDNTVAMIRNALASIPHIERAIIYGSRAKGNYRPNSDIDLTLVGDGITLSDLSRLDLALDDLYLPYSFDISVKSELTNPALVKEIEAWGKVFYPKNI